ncbi:MULTISPECIES: hypothetical protein [Halobacterium]|uniref:hypothetical protein n=1 Tax=Halobacterium TaxID=2239 RepID=UPI000AB7526C|nr:MULTISPECIES: hypothetical protein [Halobacterium]MCG1003299.1 hypothetical protein [Halobacterium noricense]
MSDWIPWENRTSEPEQRIHEGLTEKAARRIAYSINQNATRGEIDTAYSEYLTETGMSVEYFETANRRPAKESLGRFILEESLDDVLTLVEILLNELWEPSNLSSESPDPQALVDLDSKLRRILVEEGILLRLRPDSETVDNFAEKIQNHRSTSGYGSRHSTGKRPVKQFNLHFERLADESVIEADQQIRTLAKEERWADELSTYDEAWSYYKNENFSFIIAEKLYNSVEAVLLKICVEERDWNEEGDGVSSYLDSMKDHGLFDPNQAMFAEWEQILSGIQIGVQRTGGDRKRHGEFDQDYALLLLHQVSAFLSFVINRYEDEYSN